MRRAQLTELRAIADGLHTLGRPGLDTLRRAQQRYTLMQRFEALLRLATPAQRHEVAQTFKAILQETK